jgi:hypothetical protein
MLKIVAAQYRIQWETFKVQDAYAVSFRIPLGANSVTERMTDLMLSQLSWSAVKTLDAKTGEYTIGYGIGDPDDVQGYTEAQAYSEWIGDMRNRQKRLMLQLPITHATESIFDALFSLYINTGTWRVVEAEEGVYDLADAVKNGNWLLAADIISRGKHDPQLRKIEARVMQLGDYSTNKDRRQQRTQGIQLLRTQYVAGIADAFIMKQTEFAYFREFGSFLPGMSQLRQRRVIAQAKT